MVLEAAEGCVGGALPAAAQLSRSWLHGVHLRPGLRDEPPIAGAPVRIEGHRPGAEQIDVPGRHCFTYIGPPNGPIQPSTAKPR